MSRHNEGEVMNFTRGSEIWMYQTHMFIIAIFNALLFGTIVCILVGCTYSYFKTDSLQRNHGFNYLYSQMMIAVNMDKGEADIDIGDRKVKIPMVDVPKVTEAKGSQAITIMKNGFKLGGLFGLALTIFTTIYWWQYGRGQMADSRLRGSEKVEKETLIELLESEGVASDYSIADVPLVKGTEPLNIALTGAQGVGKSQNFHRLMRQVRAKGKKAIVYDPSGDFTKEFYREGKDILMNPFDKRSPSWNVWSEIENRMHYETMANGLIPAPLPSEVPFFAEASRMILKNVFKLLHDEKRTTNRDLVEALIEADFSDVVDLLEGTPAEKYMSEKSEKTALSVLMTMQNKLECFEYMSDEGKPFSIRKWMKDESDDSWMIIRTSEEAKDVLKPIMSLWINTIIKTTLTLPQTVGDEDKDKIWLFIDELPTLQKLDDLPLSLTNTRKYGLVHVLGFQDFNQIYKLYGEYDAKTILSGCQTKLLMRVTDDSSASSMAKALGDVEMDEKEISRSMGVHSARDGVSFYGRRNVKNLVLGSEIQNLDNLEGFISLAGNYPIAKVKFDYTPSPENASPIEFNDRFDIKPTKSSTEKVLDKIKSDLEKQSDIDKKDEINEINEVIDVIGGVSNKEHVDSNDIKNQDELNNLEIGLDDDIDSEEKLGQKNIEKKENTTDFASTQEKEVTVDSAEEAFANASLSDSVYEGIGISHVENDYNDYNSDDEFDFGFDVQDVGFDDSDEVVDAGKKG